MQTPPPFKVSISSLFFFFFFFPLSFSLSLSCFLSPLPLFLPASVISKRCKSIWNLVMKHTHKNADGGSSELLLRYIFLLKVQKKVIKIRKTKRKKKTKKKKKSGVGMRQKNFIPQCFSPFYCFFHFIVKKDTEWTLLKKKKIKKKI